MKCTVIVSVTSIEPLGDTTISELNFSMCSSRARAGNAKKQKSARRRLANNVRCFGRSGARFIRAAVPLGSRRAGRVEADLGSLPLGRGSDLEEFARLEA